MNLISDLETDLAFAFLVEKRHRQKIDGRRALELIGRVKNLLETTGDRQTRHELADDDTARGASAH